MVDHRIKYLVDLGHNYNPNKTWNVGPLSERDLELLTMSDVATKNMIASYQEIMGLRPDMEWGPLTDHTTRTERCGHPDYQEAGGGTFNNPCFSDGIRFSYRDRGRPSGFSKADAEAMILNVVTANAAMGAKMTRVDEGDRQQIRITWEVLRGSTIGLAQLTNGPCNELFCKINPNYARAGLIQMSALLCHEVAHNYGHQHQRSGILSPTIVQLSSWRGWEKSDPAYNVWERFGYNGFQPIPGPGPGPGPTPKPSINLEVNGHIVTARDSGDKQLGRFLVIVQGGQLQELRPWSGV